MITLTESALTTDIPASGRIRNLNLAQSGFDGLQATFEHEGAEFGQHQALCYVDGQLAAVASTTATDNVVNIPALFDGGHNINVVPALISDAYNTIRFDDEDGTRALLTWPPSGDVAGYKILSYPALELIDTVTDRTTIPMNKAIPTTGTGRGRVSVNPVSSPDNLNGTLILIIDSAGSCHFDFNGAVTLSESFTQGSTVYYEGAIGFTFEDAPENYVTNDQYRLYLGVQTRWLSPQLSPGNYQYSIVAFDAYGRDSDPELAVSEIIEIVEQATAFTPTESWNDTAKILTISGFPPTHYGYNIYTNYLPQEDVLLDYVCLEPAISTESTSIASQINIPAAEGTFLYYIRPLSAAGVELQDFTLHTVTIPTPEDIVSEPENLVAKAVGVQNWNLTFDYFYLPGDALASLTIHRVPHGDPFTYDVADTVTTIAASAIGDNYTDSFDYTTTAETATAGELDIQVVAHSTGGTLAYSETVTVTTVEDATIDAPSPITGGAA